MKLLYFLLLVPTLSFSQSKAAYSVASQFDFIENSTNYGIRFSAGSLIRNSITAGAGFGITKLKNNSQPVIPIYLHFSFCNYSKNISPYIVFEPGYGIYNDGKDKDPGAVRTKGGLNIYSGAGVAVGGNIKAAITAGYSYYGFDVAGSDRNIDGFSIRALITGIKSFK